MREHLFDHVDIDPKNIHIPGRHDCAREGLRSSASNYERDASRKRAGSIFRSWASAAPGTSASTNPARPRDSRTRLITLDRVTRLDAASDFFGEWNVPRKAITMGVGTILSAPRCILLAFGEGKAPVIRKAVEGEITDAVAASFLQQHPNARIVLDTAAAAELTRFKTPWLLGSLEDSA